MWVLVLEIVSGHLVIFVAIHANSSRITSNERINVAYRMQFGGFRPRINTFHKYWSMGSPKQTNKQTTWFWHH